MLAFELATVPDVAGARRLNAFGDLDDDDVVRALGQQQLQRTGDERLPPHLQRIVAVGVTRRGRDGLEMRALGDAETDEAALLVRLFEALAETGGACVSWNASGADPAVIAHRAMLHGAGPARGHDWRADYLALAAALDGGGVPRAELAALLGFPIRVHPESRTREDWVAGRLREIRADCVIEAVSTYLLHLRHLRLRGQLDEPHLNDEIALAAETLAEWGPPQGHGIAVPRSAS